ncbi:F-box domain-containing protein, partial [Favolaschia claudopus]
MEADRALLAQNEAHIRDIQSLPPDLQRSQSLSELHEAKAVIQNRLDAFIYPVLTLPNEVVSEIFIQFLPAYPKPPPLVGTSSPTLLTHICQKWRAIALATPKLWRVIDM